MITELNPPEKIFAFGASPSMVQLWQTCKHRWWLHYVARVGRGESTAAMTSGNAAHLFLQTYHHPDFAHITWEEHAEFFKADYPIEMEDAKRPQAHCLKVLKEYTKVYPQETSEWEMLDLEPSIRVEVPGCKLPLNVRLDMVMNYMNGLWVVDYKTVNRSVAFDDFRNTWQTYVYIYAAGKHYGRQCQGIWYDVINFKKTMNRESFQRKDFPKMQSQIDHAMEQWVATVNEMYDYVKEHWKDKTKFLQVNQKIGCRSFFSNCPFLDYCEMNQNERLLPQPKKENE